VRCQTDFCVLNVTAKEPLPAPFVVAPASAPSLVSQLAFAKTAREAVTSVVMFVAVLAKMKRPTELSSHQWIAQNSVSERLSSGVDFWA
jgi:hypothetical protein